MEKNKGKKINMSLSVPHDKKAGYLRVPARLEGKVKNVAIKPVRKKGKK